MGDLILANIFLRTAVIANNINKTKIMGSCGEANTISAFSGGTTGRASRAQFIAVPVLAKAGVQVRILTTLIIIGIVRKMKLEVVLVNRDQAAAVVFPSCPRPGVAVVSEGKIVLGAASVSIIIIIIARP